MKWLKRLLLLVVFFAVFAGVLGLGGLWLSRGTPQWYSRRRANPQELAAAAHRAEQEMARTLNWANQQAHSAPASQPAATQPAQPLDISLTEDELNGFFQKWSDLFGWEARYENYLSDPQIILQNHQFILAATVKQMNSVVSVVFEPRIEEGKLQMPVSQVLAGRLPLPRTFWDPYRDRLEASVDRHLPEWQENARISPAGAANSDAVAAAMGELLLDVLQNRPAKPVLFLPQAAQGHKSLPVKLTSVNVTDKSITLSVEPLDPSQRETLLKEIRSFQPRVAVGGNAPSASEQN